MAVSDKIRVDTRSATDQEKSYLRKGGDQPGGKLPIFDDTGQPIPAQVIKACIVAGWAEPWFANPMKPDWLVCRLTPAGRKAAR